MSFYLTALLAGNLVTHLPYKVETIVWIFFLFLMRIFVQKWLLLLKWLLVKIEQVCKPWNYASSKLCRVSDWHTSIEYRATKKCMQTSSGACKRKELDGAPTKTHLLGDLLAHLPCHWVALLARHLISKYLNLLFLLLHIWCIMSNIPIMQSFCYSMNMKRKNTGYRETVFSGNFSALLLLHLQMLPSIEKQLLFFGGNFESRPAWGRSRTPPWGQSHILASAPVSQCPGSSPPEHSQMI